MVVNIKYGILLYIRKYIILCLVLCFHLYGQNTIHYDVIWTVIYRIVT